MNKEYLDALKDLREFVIYCRKSNEDVGIIEKALTRLESIDNAEPTEALECLERIDNTLCLNNNKGKLEFGVDTEEHTDCDSAIGMVEDLETIKQALLKAEKEHKALEILKKIIDFDLVELDRGRHKVCIYPDNDEGDVVRAISEEEFKALEEVLE